MLYEFAINNPSHTIAALVIVIVFIIAVAAVVTLSTKEESSTKPIIVIIFGVIAVICSLYLFFHVDSDNFTSYEEKFTEYFGETPESIDFDNGNFTVKTEEKIYSFTNVKEDYYSVEIFEKIDSEQH